MELDASAEDSVTMDWEPETFTVDVEIITIKHVQFNDILDISFITKPEKPDGKPWRPTTKHYMDSRMMRKMKFDPIESPRRRADIKNALFLEGCRCEEYYQNNDVCIWCSRFGYSTFGY